MSAGWTTVSIAVKYYVRFMLSIRRPDTAVRAQKAKERTACDRVHEYSTGGVSISAMILENDYFYVLLFKS
ncbi:hypothetical protein ACFL0H_08635 [Thermodesulfobacteriota bacterium]